MKPILKSLLLLAFSITLLPLTACSQEVAEQNTQPMTEKAAKLVNAAKWQIGKTTSYDPAYVSLEYPNGDIPIEKGVCTDVIIRALRKAHDIDLQKVVYLDMKANFSKYPKIWGLKRTDRNIDHRRVPNLQTYFKRKGWSLPVTKNAKNYKAGDIVSCTVAGKLPHIMIVSDKLNAEGIPHIIHNIGR